MIEISDTREITLPRVGINTICSPILMQIFLISHSRMSHPKHCALLEGDVLTDLSTGQRYMLQPTEQEIEQGIWQYDPEADGAKWHDLLLNGVTYAVNGLWVDWDEDILEWDSPNMGQWPFGNRLTEEELFLREVDTELFLLDCFLESELEWMCNDIVVNAICE